MTTLRSGASNQYSANWGAAFGPKKSSMQTAKSTKKNVSAAKSGSGKLTAAKAAPAKAAKKGSDKKGAVKSKSGKK